MAGDNVTDNDSQIPSDVHTNVSKSVSGQELQMASVISSACGVDHHTMRHPALVDCISENGNSQSIRDTLSGTFQGKGTGFGGRCGNFVYHLGIARGFRNWTIVHLEMVNILLAMKLFAYLWASKKILIRCDNQAVVTVLKSGKTRDAFLAASARNIWYVTAIHDIEVQYTHICGARNQVADTLSRWQGSVTQIEFLHSQISHPVGLPVSMDLLEMDPYL